MAALPEPVQGPDGKWRIRCYRDPDCAYVSTSKTAQSCRDQFKRHSKKPCNVDWQRRRAEAAIRDDEQQREYERQYQAQQYLKRKYAALEVAESEG